MGLRCATVGSRVRNSATPLSPPLFANIWDTAAWDLEVSEPGRSGLFFFSLHSDRGLSPFVPREAVPVGPALPLGLFFFPVQPFSIFCNGIQIWFKCFKVQLPTVCASLTQMGHMRYVNWVEFHEDVSGAVHFPMWANLNLVMWQLHISSPQCCFKFNFAQMITCYTCFWGRKA